MSLKLGDIIAAIRSEHPAFDKSRVPDAILAAVLSTYQNELITQCVMRDKTYAAQTIGVAMATGATTPDADLSVDLTVDGVPFTTTTSGFLVQLDGSGVPFLDSASPLMVIVGTGLSLPIVQGFIGGTVHYNDGGNDEELTFVSFGRRFTPPQFPAVWFKDQMVMLCGTALDWQEVTSIELLVTPFAPALASLTDYFLVPDGAKAVLTARGNKAAAVRATAFAGESKGPAADLGYYAAEFKEAESRYLDSLRITRRGRHTTFTSPDDC